MHMAHILLCQFVFICYSILAYQYGKHHEGKHAMVIKFSSLLALNEENTFHNLLCEVVFIFLCNLGYFV